MMNKNTPMNNTEAAIEKILASFDEKFPNDKKEGYWEYDDDEGEYHIPTPNKIKSFLLHAMVTILKSAAGEDKYNTTPGASRVLDGWNAHRQQMLDYAEAISNKIQST